MTKVEISCFFMAVVVEKLKYAFPGLTGKPVIGLL